MYICPWSRPCHSLRLGIFRQAGAGTILGLILLNGCGTPVISPGAERPDGTTTLVAMADPGSPVAQVGVVVALSATASGGRPPYLFRWDQNGGPVELELVGESGPTLELGALPEPGRYVFRVIVTDQSGATASDFVVVEATDDIEVSVPALAIVKDATLLAASVADAPAGTTFAWSVTRGSATIENGDSDNAVLIASTGETIGVRLTISLPFGDTTTRIEREFEVVSVDTPTPEVLVETSLGEFTLRLEGEAAPTHVANFLAYVDDRFYDGLLFHRVACRDGSDPNSDACLPFVVQGGGFERVGGELLQRGPTRDPIESEAPNGLTNGELYSVALALTGGDPDSGAAQFFINLSIDNGFLDDQGFTVLGRVQAGTEVVDAIASVETTDNPLLGGELSLPVQDVIIERVTRVFP